MGKWRNLHALAWGDRWTLAQAAVMLAYVRVMMRFIEFRAEAGSVTDVACNPAPRTIPARARAIARLVEVAAAHEPFAVACLHRSVVLWWLLRREGIRCDFRIGARLLDGPFEAHAWVECEGEALNEQAARLERYAPFGASVVPRRRRGSPRLAVRRSS